MIFYDKIQEALAKVYEEYFIFVEDIFREEFNCTLDTLRSKSKKTPLPYLRLIYTNHFNNQGVSYQSIAKRLNKNHSTLVIMLNKYNDYYKYIPEFRELADRFNNKLKEIQDGTNE